MKISDRTGAASEALTPAFGERGIAVAFFADLNYFPYVAVAVRSIVETASSENSYDVLVFTDADVRTPIRERLLDVTRGCSNVSLRLEVLDAADLLSIKGLFVGGLSSMTYGRLLLPTLLADYRRAIYLDVDVVVREDLAHLFAIDLKGNLVGAVKDEGVVRYSVPPIWREGVLKVCPDFDFDRYVNAGLLLMDLDGLRREKSMMRALELSARNQFLFCDFARLDVVGCRFADILSSGVCVCARPEESRSARSCGQGAFQSACACQGFGSASLVDSNARGQSSGKWQEAFLHFCPLAGEMARQADAAWHSVAFRGVILEEECMR